MITLQQVQLKRASLEVEIEGAVRKFIAEIHPAGIRVEEVNVELVDATIMSGSRYNQVANVEIKLAI